MKAVIFGAGNIGRGLIGALFSEAGYEVTALSYNGTAITPLTGGSDQSTYTFTMPNDDVTVTAAFTKVKNKVAFTVAPANSGEVWLTSGTTYDQGLGYSYSTVGTTVGIALAGDITEIVDGERRGRVRSHVQFLNAEIDTVGSSLNGCCQRLSRPYGCHYFIYLIRIHSLS